MVKAVLGTEAQRGQDLRAHLHGGLAPGHGLDHRHAVVVNHGVGQFVHVGHLVAATAHQPFDRTDRVGRITDLRGERVETDLATSAPELRIQVSHHAGQDDAAVQRRQAFGHAMPDRGHQRVCGAQVDADRHTSLVRVEGLTGFGDLQECHGRRRKKRE